MIPVRDEDIVVSRRTGDGRFVLFTSTDVQPGWPLPWWGVVADTGGDGFGLLVRLDDAAAPTGWTGRQLLHVVRHRLAEEAGRGQGGPAAASVEALDLAAACRWERAGPGAKGDAGVTFRPGAGPTAYAWTTAACGPFELPLCPDPAGREEGVTPEQLLIILDQLLHDAARALPHMRDLWAARRHVAAALAAEVRRLEAIRA